MRPTPSLSTRVRAAALVAVLALLLAACGGGGEQQTAEGGASPAPETAAPSAKASDEPSEDAPSEDEPSEDEPSEEPTEEASGGAVGSIDDVEQAVVQIVSEGSFRDPEIGQYEASGSGSGFIIDPEGIAVTNNHVVTGAATLDVFVAGEDDPVNAQVLGVSECSDLAVIDLEGGDYPYLEWYDGEPEQRTDVAAAGFPLGDPEFTVTDGSISRSEHDVDTGWASVDAVIEHTARINPGNSGGPLVDLDGSVVGVNYAGDAETDQNLAISVTEARDIVEQLAEGEDEVTIGVNGQAVMDDAGNSGVWVSSVDPGSAAATAGIAGGDIITGLANVTVGDDGTMAKYCDVLRTQGTDAVVPVEVLRYDTEEVLGGELNGAELALVTSFAQELEGEATTDTGSDATYAEYVTIADDTGAISVDVPAEWGDVDGAPYTGEDGLARTDVRASSDLAAFQSTWETPGMIFTASSAVAQSSNEFTLLDELNGSLVEQCETYEGRQPYSDPLYTGQFDSYLNCGGTGAAYIVVGAVPPDRSYVIQVQIQVNRDRDLEAADRILNSFVVTGGV